MLHAASRPRCRPVRPQSNPRPRHQPARARGEHREARLGHRRSSTAIQRRHAPLHHPDGQSAVLGSASAAVSTQPTSSSHSGRPGEADLGDECDRPGRLDVARSGSDPRRSVAVGGGRWRSVAVGGGRVRGFGRLGQASGISRGGLARLANMNERRLPGGNTGGACLVDGTVRRASGPWTPAVHALLDYLHAQGFAGAPRALGVDETGREVLSFMPGITVGDSKPWPAWVRSEAALLDVGDWLRSYHEIVAAFVPPADACWRTSRRAWRPGDVIGHNDAAPYNAVWRPAPRDEGDPHSRGLRGRLVGFIDWDFRRSVLAVVGSCVHGVLMGVAACPRRCDERWVQSVRRAPRPTSPASRRVRIRRRGG